MNKKPIPLKRANRLINNGCTVLVTARHGEKESIITLAWQTPVSKSPPLAAISVGPSRYSHDLIAKSGQFVINVPPFSLLKETIYCGTVSGRDGDKFAGAGLTQEPAQTVSAPLIAECIGHLECRVVKEISAGDHTLFLGEIVAASAEPVAQNDSAFRFISARHESHIELSDFDLGRIHVLFFSLY